MKNRDYKNFAEGECYHIFNRGVGKMDIFLDNQDYLNFLKRLKIVLDLEPKRIPLLGGSKGESFLHLSSLPKDSFEIICYSIMPNHFHFIIRQLNDIPISKLISKVCTSYSMYFNRKYNRVGSLLQGPFKAINISDDEYLLWLSVYIHQNPHVAGLVRNLKDWKWSSYPDYVGLRHGTLCKKDVVLERFKTSSEYEAYVDSGFDIIKSKEELKDLMLDF